MTDGGGGGGGVDNGRTTVGQGSTGWAVGSAEVVCVRATVRACVRVCEHTVASTSAGRVPRSSSASCTATV